MPPKRIPKITNITTPKSFSPKKTSPVVTKKVSTKKSREYYEKKTVEELKKVQKRYGIQDSSIPKSGKTILKTDRIKAILDYKKKNKKEKKISQNKISSHKKISPKKISPKKNSSPKKILLSPKKIDDSEETIEMTADEIAQAIKLNKNDKKDLKKDIMNILSQSNKFKHTSQKYVKSPKNKLSQSHKANMSTSSALKPYTSPKKISLYKFKIMFEYKQNKPLIFDFTIEKEDYETFYNIVQYFFSDENVDKKMFNKIKELYGIKKKYDDMTSLDEVFGKNFVVSTIKNIGDDTYKISWST